MLTPETGQAAFNLNTYLGVRDVLQRSQVVWLARLRFFLLRHHYHHPHPFPDDDSITDIHFLHGQPGKVTYASIYVNQTTLLTRFETAVATLTADPDVAKLSPLVTSQFKVIQPDGTLGNPQHRKR